MESGKWKVRDDVKKDKFCVTSFVIGMATMAMLWFFVGGLLSLGRALVSRVAKVRCGSEQRESVDGGAQKRAARACDPRYTGVGGHGDVLEGGR